MKIFAITDNYYGGDPAGAEGPGWRFLPDSAVFRAPNPHFLEDERSSAGAFPTLAVRIDRLGKSIAPRFASRYTGHVAIAVNIRDLDAEERLRRSGLPIDPAWGYDRSLLLSDWFEVPFDSIAEAEVSVSLSEGAVLVWRASELTVGLPGVIEAVSRTNLLKMGDIILPGFHRNGLALSPDRMLKATLRLPGADGRLEESIEIPIR